jgi:predicted amidohydrolase
MSTVRVAAVQMDPVLGDREGNLRVIINRLSEAAGEGARLVVFPECALTGYGFDSKDEAMAQAEPVPGPSLDLLADSCADLGVFAVVGLLERDGDRLFNACAVVGPMGELACYRKVHLPFMGVDRFADPGDRPFEVVETAGLRIGLQICYDGIFPEGSRIQALQGADVIVLPTNWPPSSIPAAEHLPIVRAMENTVFFMAVNRVGEERGFPFVGRSSIVDPSGNVLAQGGPDTEQVLIADLDPVLSRTKKLVRIPGKQEIDRIADRRPEFYGPIARPKGTA